jgi:replication-associated recombination protein RarA
MKTNKNPVPKKSSIRMSEKSNEAYSTINRAVINRESTSIPFQGNKIHDQSMEKFGFQRSTIPKHQSGEISTHTNYSSYRPQKIYYHRTQNKPITEAVRPNIIQTIETQISLLSNLKLKLVVHHLKFLNKI